MCTGDSLCDCMNCSGGADYDEDEGGDDAFADPGGRSALRAASDSNPRNLPCPTCGAENVLTPADVRHGYHCDACADRAEGRNEY